jgi:hypothetical protein
MTESIRTERIQELVKKECRFAYSVNPKESLDDVLSKTNQFKKVRLEAERAAMQEFRIEHPNNETSIAELEDKGLVRIWDLREEE